MNCRTSFYWLLHLMNLCQICVVALRLQGTWNSNDFFLFLAKFGFQKTNIHDKENSQGYIYGNITTRTNASSQVTLVAVNKDYFLKFYENRTLHRQNIDVCSIMFSKIDTVAYDHLCNVNGQEDFLRRVPCPVGGVCVDHRDLPEKLVQGSQFTYQIEDINQPRFWYVSLVSCCRAPNGLNVNSSEFGCNWTSTDKSGIDIDYDIWLVNGNPYTKQRNPFEFQFSYDNVDTVEIYSVFFLVYSVAIAMQIYAVRKRSHPLTRLLTFCLAMEFFGILLNIIHVLKFALDGIGIEKVMLAGNLIDILAECCMMMLLLLIAKGWMITRMRITCKFLLFSIWSAYTCVYVFLFVWNLTEVDVIQDLDEYQTWPGWMILVFRLAIMVWFLLELRKTFVLENKPEKLDFYLHFGAGFLVWFVYLPLIAVIAAKISALWRFKLILSITNAADFLAFIVLMHLLWPSRTVSYFEIKSDIDLISEEMEEFEAETIIGEVSSIASSNSVTSSAKA